jgi:hypothetical protein
MAYISDATKLDRLWKLAFNKTRGDSTAQFFEELIPSVVDIHASEIPGDTIPSTPPGSTTSVIKKWYSGAEGQITMTLDRKYNGNRVWVAKESVETAFSSGSGDITNIMKNFVSPKYGTGYVVKVYDGSDVQIAELFGNSSGTINTGSWLFDYKSGVLVFESDRSENGSSTFIKIEVYQYIGRFVSTKADIVEGGETGNITVLDSEGNLTDGGYSISEIRDKSFEFEQLTALDTWVVVHNLGKMPSVTVVDSSGEMVIGDVTHNNLNQLTITFSSGFAGKAYCN